MVNKFNARQQALIENVDDLDLDNTTIALELEQGRSQNAGKLQGALLK
jgi:hypothetical protein